MVRGQRDRFEAKFGALLTAARALPTRLAEAVDASYSDGVPGDQFPEATAARQMLRVLPLYHAAIAALANSETALRALALMRPLMEAWAQLYFIMGERTRQADRAGRYASKLVGRLIPSASPDQAARRPGRSWRRLCGAKRTLRAFKASGAARDPGEITGTATRPFVRWTSGWTSTGC
jgi:hypothetical protein